MPPEVADPARGASPGARLDGMDYRPTGAERAQRAAFMALLGLPVRVRRAIAGRPEIVDGQRLDPDLQVGLAVLNRLPAKELDEMPVPEARAALKSESWIFAGESPEVGGVTDVRIADRFGARLYLPPRPARASKGSTQPMAAVVYLHGGGWVLGDVETHDVVCRRICVGAEVAVLNVDYRLAPEHPFPAAVEDSVEAFRWLREHAGEHGIDPDRIAVAGDSAGGNLSAVVCQVTRDEGTPMPAFQALVVPATDFSTDYPSATTFAEGYFLTQANMDWYEQHYLGNHDRTDPRASPLLANDLSGLPPAYVAVAGWDPLRDEGVAYAEALRAAGVPVTLRVHEDAVHPFINIGAVDLGRRCQTELIGALRVGLGV